MVVLKVKYESDMRRVAVPSISMDELTRLVKELFNIEKFSLRYVDVSDGSSDLITIVSDEELQEGIRIGNGMLRIDVQGEKKTNNAVPEARSGASSSATSTETPPNPANPMEGFQTFLGGIFNQIEQAKVSQDLSHAFQNLNVEQGGQEMADEVQKMVAPFVQVFTGAATPSNSEKGSPQQASPPTKDERRAPGPEKTHHVGVTCDGCETAIYGIRYKCTVCWDFDLCEKCEAKQIHDQTHTMLKIKAPQNHGIGGRAPYGRCGRGRGRFGGGRNRGGRFFGRFLEDVTIRDQTTVTTTSPFVKIWKMVNDGEEAWPEETVLKFIGGDQMNANLQVEVGKVAPKAEIDIAVDLVAPSEPGRYCGYWRLCNPNANEGNNRFGHRIWVDIHVVAEENPKEEKMNELLDSVLGEDVMETEEPKKIAEEVVSEMTPLIPLAQAVQEAESVKAAEQEEAQKTAALDASLQAMQQQMEEELQQQQMQIEQEQQQQQQQASAPVSIPVRIVEGVQCTDLEKTYLETLREMGFTDEARNLEVLRKHDGDMVECIRILLGGQ